jgi:hypothetical protein
MGEHPKVGIRVICAECGHQKKPHGRSAPMGFKYCDDECHGYLLKPEPGCLWPGETDSDFGYPCCDNATEPLPAPPEANQSVTNQ